MTPYKFLYGLISAISVLTYYPIANRAGWSQRSVLDMKTAYWNAFQAFVWSFAILWFRTTPLTIWALLPILPTTLIYGAIGENPALQFDLSATTKLTTEAIAVLATVGILFFFYLVSVLYHRFANFDMASNFIFFLPLLVFVAWILSWLAFSKPSVSSTQQTQGGFDYHGHYTYGYTETDTTTTTSSIHFHHWMIAIIGMLLARDGRVMSDIVSGIFWGVFCQEMAAYGVAIPLDSKQVTVPTYQQNLLKGKNPVYPTHA
jgi:hypothetical protein